MVYFNSAVTLIILSVRTEPDSPLKPVHRQCFVLLFKDEFLHICNGIDIFSHDDSLFLSHTELLPSHFLKVVVVESFYDFGSHAHELLGPALKHHSAHESSIALFEDCCAHDVAAVCSLVEP